MSPNEERPDVPENTSSDPLDVPYPEDSNMTELGKIWAYANDRSESRIVESLKAALESKKKMGHIPGE